MTVGELIEALEDFDPESRVLLMTQQNWPFENSIYGITSRDEIARDPEDDEETKPLFVGSRVGVFCKDSGGMA